MNSSLRSWPHRAGRVIIPEEFANLFMMLDFATYSLDTTTNYTYSFDINLYNVYLEKPLMAMYFFALQLNLHTIRCGGRASA